MIAADWPRQTVGAFLGAVPWKGASIVPLAAPASKAKSLDWRSQCVGAFFSSIAWDGQRFQAQTDIDTQASRSLSYLLPVQSFFSCFVWQERPNIGVIPQISARATQVPELSLDDLSDLF
jgi:hypothetical protein